MPYKVINNDEKSSAIGESQNSVVNTINDDNINTDCENNSEKRIDENTNNATNQFSDTRADSVTSDSINNISIETLDDDNEDSSVVDSDSDCENHIQSTQQNEYGASSGIVLVNRNVDPHNSCRSNSSYSNNNSSPNFGSIAIQNSQDITFGNKTYNQGTVNYYINSQNEWKKVDPDHNQHYNSDANINNSTDDIIKEGKSQLNLS